MVFEGAPGLGKTSLLRAAAREAERRGFEVARARGAELEREWPFGIVRQLLEPALRRRSAAERAQLLEGAAGLAAHLLLPELAGVTTDVDASFGTLHGLYWLCANLATEQPLLLAVDDAQWADEASLRFLGVLARRLDALPALVVLAQRPGPPAHSPSWRPIPRPKCSAFVLSRTRGHDALLAEWSPDRVVDREFALACDERDGRQPLPLEPARSRSCATRAIAFTAAQAGRVTIAGTDAVRDAVGAMLARLDATAVALAEAVAVLGDDAELAVAAELAGIDQADAAADELARFGVLDDARPLRFVHAIVRDAVAARLSAGVRDRRSRARRRGPRGPPRRSRMRSRSICWRPSRAAGRGSSISSPPRRGGRSPRARPRRRRRCSSARWPSLRPRHRKPSSLLELARAESRLGRPSRDRALRAGARARMRPRAARACRDRDELGRRPDARDRRDPPATGASDRRPRRRRQNWAWSWRRRASPRSSSRRRRRARPGWRACRNAGRSWKVARRASGSCSPSSRSGRWKPAVRRACVPRSPNVRSARPASRRSRAARCH